MRFFLRVHRILIPRCFYSTPCTNHYITKNIQPSYTLGPSYRPLRTPAYPRGEEGGESGGEKRKEKIKREDGTQGGNGVDVLWLASTPAATRTDKKVACIHAPMVSLEKAGTAMV